MSEEFVTKSQDPNINLGQIAELNHLEEQRLLADVVERQIQDFEDLGNNLFDDNELDNFILVDVLTYVAENYIPIPHMETIIVDPSTVSKVGRFAYELFVVDLLDYIIPKMLLQLDLKDPVELPIVNYDGFKSTLKQVVLDRLEGIQRLYKASGSEELYTLVLKWTFYYDLFDGNLENFIENVITIMVNAYETKITSKLIDI